MVYSSLLLAASLLLTGYICYFLQKFEIGETNKLYRFRPSKNNLLIKLRIFKYDWRFNYFLLIPYLFSWGIFLTVFILYILYWTKINTMKDLFLSYWFNFTLAAFIILMMIYIAVIQVVIDMNSLPDFRFPKDETEEEGFMRSNFEYSTKEDREKDDITKDETKDKK